jgi:hypothetical protein
MFDTTREDLCVERDINNRLSRMLSFVYGHCSICSQTKATCEQRQTNQHETTLAEHVDVYDCFLFRISFEHAKHLQVKSSNDVNLKIVENRLKTLENKLNLLSNRGMYLVVYRR